MPAPEDPTAAARQALVEGLARRGIRDRRVLAALGRVPRHLFAPPELRKQGYVDDVIPLGSGATLSQPFVVAAMLEALDLHGGERVLDIGSGSGYTTALLCELAGFVYGIERDPGLAERSGHRMRDLGYGNFQIRAGDGWEGWMEHFPYDGILVSAAVPALPPKLLDQLAAGGTLVAPVGGAEYQILRVLHLAEDGSATRSRDLFGVRFVPLVRGRSET